MCEVSTETKAKSVCSHRIVRAQSISPPHPQHCKPKPCKAYRELPVSQFSLGKTSFHYREPLFSLQGPCFHYRDFPVNPCTSLLGIAVQYEKNALHKFCFSKKHTHPTHTKYEYLLLINHTEK